MLLDYFCATCDAVMRDYLHRTSDTPDVKPPESFDCPNCGTSAGLKKKRVYRNAVLGPVWTGLDEINSSLLSVKDRRRGKEIKNARDIQALEDAKGMFRPTETEARVWQDESRHDGALIRKKLKEDGEEAALDYVDTTEIMGVTGWTQPETEKWKERTRVATNELAAKSFEPSST